MENSGIKLVNLPNLITLGNLACGCLGIIWALEGNLVLAACLTFLAAFLDFFDGFAARMLKIEGELGKQLDSLADMVTFGVLPGVIAFQLLSPTLLSDTGWLSHMNMRCFYDTRWYHYLVLAIPLLSALRLAKFNIDTRQSDSFIGLPTPANGVFWSSIPLIFHSIEQEWFGILNEHYLTEAGLIFIGEFTLIGFSLALSLLLVSEIPMFSLKFKSFGWKGNELRWSFLLLCVALLATLWFAALPIIILLYIVLSVINNLQKRST